VFTKKERIKTKIIFLFSKNILSLSDG